MEEKEIAKRGWIDMSELSEEQFDMIMKNSEADYIDIRYVKRLIFGMYDSNLIETLRHSRLYRIEIQELLKIIHNRILEINKLNKLIEKKKYRGLKTMIATS